MIMRHSPGVDLIKIIELTLDSFVSSQLLTQNELGQSFKKIIFILDALFKIMGCGVWVSYCLATGIA